MGETTGEAQAGGLTRRAIHAGTSMAVMTAIENALLLLRTLILSRLLSPHEFGLMGMAYVAILTADVLSQTGFGRAIVQRRGDPEPYLDTLWCVALLRGMALSLVLFAGAPLLGLFFRTPEVVPVVRLIALGPALIGMCSPRWFLLERELRLASFALPRVAGAAADLVVTSVLAWQLRSVYALAGGYLVFTAVMVATTYFVGPCRPRPRLDFARARELYAFGKHIFRLDLLTYGVDQLERVTVGRLRDATQFGLYSFGFRMATLPTSMLFTTLLRVVFPSFARIQNEPARIRVAYLRLMGLMAIVSWPVAAGLVGCATLLVPVAFGPVWIPMIPVFQVLCLMAGLVSLGQICGAVAGGLGLAAVPARGSMVRLAVLGLLVIPATSWYGIIGTAWCSAAAALASTTFLLIALGRHLHLTLRDHVVIFRVPAIGCVALLAAVAATSRAVGGLAPPLALAALIGAGCLAYFISALAADHLTGSTLAGDLRGLRRSVS
jgi:PST family polysaccharide transporter/lipopolysaccharide exporter